MMQLAKSDVSGPL